MFILNSRHKAKNITHNSNAIMDHGMFAETSSYRIYLIKTGASILENLGDEKLSETEFVKRFIHKKNKPGTPCSNVDGKPTRFILRVLKAANMINVDKNGFYTSTLEAINKFGGKQKHNFERYMTEFIENFLRDNPNSRRSPRKSCQINNAEIDDLLLNGIVEDTVTDSFASTGDVSSERDGVFRASSLPVGDNAHIRNVDEGCNKRPRTAKDDASNSWETPKTKNIRTTRSRVAHNSSFEQTIQHSACNHTTTSASGGVHTELTQLQKFTFSYFPSEFSTAQTTHSTTGTDAITTTTTTINHDILDTDATADLSMLFKTTSVNSFEMSSNSACSYENPTEV